MAAEGRSAFPDQVAAASRSHAGRVSGAGRDIATVSTAIGRRLSVEHQGHFAAQDHVGGFFGVCMIGVENVGAVLPDVGVAKTLFAQGCRQFFLVNAGAHTKLDTMRRPRVSSQPDEFSLTKPFRPAKARCAKTATPLSLPFLATEERRAHCLQERRSLETDLESGRGA